VRELKLHAPELVRRAAGGERIVVTKRGTPVAVLAPLDAAEAAGEHPSLSAWNRERRAFEQLTPALTKKYSGQWVAISGGKVVDSATSYEALLGRVLRKLRTSPFFLGRVGAVAPVVDMPGFEIE
jgi:prevent-host-death family protein